MKPGDIVRVTYGVNLIYISPYRNETLGKTRKDEILLVLEPHQVYVKILHPSLGVGWVNRTFLEVISEAYA